MSKKHKFYDFGERFIETEDGITLWVLGMHRCNSVASRKWFLWYLRTNHPCVDHGFEFITVDRFVLSKVYMSEVEVDGEGGYWTECNIEDKGAIKATRCDLLPEN